MVVTGAQVPGENPQVAAGKAQRAVAELNLARTEVLFHRRLERHQAGRVIVDEQDFGLDHVVLSSVEVLSVRAGMVADCRNLAILFYVHDNMARMNKYQQFGDQGKLFVASLGGSKPLEKPENCQ